MGVPDCARTPLQCFLVLYDYFRAYRSGRCVKRIERRRLCKMHPISSVSLASSMLCLGSRTISILQER